MVSKDTSSSRDSLFKVYSEYAALGWFSGPFWTLDLGNPVCFLSAAPRSRVLLPQGKVEVIMCPKKLSVKQSS